MTQQTDDLTTNSLDDLEDDEFKEDEELWGEWTENPDTEDEVADPKNMDDFYSADEE